MWSKRDCSVPAFCDEAIVIATQQKCLNKKLKANRKWCSKCWNTF